MDFNRYLSQKRPKAFLVFRLRLPITATPAYASGSRQHGIKHSLASLYNPRANGVIETLHSTLKISEANLIAFATTVANSASHCPTRHKVNSEWCNRWNSILPIFQSPHVYEASPLSVDQGNGPPSPTRCTASEYSKWWAFRCTYTKGSHVLVRKGDRSSVVLDARKSGGTNRTIHLRYWHRWIPASLQLAKHETVATSQRYSLPCSCRWSIRLRDGTQRTATSGRIQRLVSSSGWYLVDSLPG